VALHHFYISQNDMSCVNFSMTETITKICTIHGEQLFAKSGNGYFRCKKCRYQDIVRRRLKLKSILVTELGGKCERCGYNKCVRAMEFHHKDRSQKEFGICEKLCYSLERLRKEAQKCILLCCRCHREVEEELFAVH